MHPRKHGPANSPVPLLARKAGGGEAGGDEAGTMRRRSGAAALQIVNVRSAIAGNRAVLPDFDAGDYHAVAPKRHAKPVLARTNFAIQIHSHLEESIVSGKFPPGTKLSEEDIAEAYGVSRQPVREAIARLERQGFATRGRRDRVIASPSEKLIAETYEVWWILEAVRTYLSSLAATAKDVARLRRLLKQMEAVSGGTDKAAAKRLSKEFHELLRQPERNAQLDESLRTFALYIRWFKSLYLKRRKSAEARLDEHRRLVGCFERKDLAGLIEVMRGHVLRQRNEILARLRRGLQAPTDP